MFRPFYSNFTLNICFVAALILCLKGFISYYGRKICTAPGIDTGFGLDLIVFSVSFFKRTFSIIRPSFDFCFSLIFSVSAFRELSLSGV